MLWICEKPKHYLSNCRERYFPASPVISSCVAHPIKLSFLAPDIIQAILRGEVPADLSLGTPKAGFSLD